MEWAGKGGREGRSEHGSRKVASVETLPEKPSLKSVEEGEGTMQGCTHEYSRIQTLRKKIDSEIGAIHALESLMEQTQYKKWHQVRALCIGQENKTKRPHTCEVSLHFPCHCNFPFPTIQQSIEHFIKIRRIKSCRKTFHTWFTFSNSPASRRAMLSIALIDRITLQQMSIEAMIYFEECASMKSAFVSWRNELLASAANFARWKTVAASVLHHRVQVNTLIDRSSNLGLRRYIEHVVIHSWKAYSRMTKILLSRTTARHDSKECPMAVSKIRRIEFTLNSDKGSTENSKFMLKVNIDLKFFGVVARNIPLKGMIKDSEFELLQHSRSTCTIKAIFKPRRLIEPRTVSLVALMPYLVKLVVRAYFWEWRMFVDKHPSVVCINQDNQDDEYLTPAAMCDKYSYGQLLMQKSKTKILNRSLGIKNPVCVRLGTTFGRKKVRTSLKTYLQREECSRAGEQRDGSSDGAGSRGLA
eukprot:708826-Hanusia_phi.AAC.1